MDIVEKDFNLNFDMMDSKFTLVDNQMNVILVDYHHQNVGFPNDNLDYSHPYHLLAVDKMLPLLLLHYSFRGDQPTSCQDVLSAPFLDVRAAPILGDFDLVGPYWEHFVSTHNYLVELNHNLLDASEGFPYFTDQNSKILAIHKNQIIDGRKMKYFIEMVSDGSDFIGMVFLEVHDRLVLLKILFLQNSGRPMVHLMD